MTTYPTAPAADNAAPAPCVDLLPLRGGRRGTLTWQPVRDDYSPLAGFARIAAGRGDATYSVTECPADLGRTFMVAKIGTPVNKRRGYVVTCVRAGDESVGACECSGFEFTGHCKHLDAVATLILNRWL